MKSNTLKLTGDGLPNELRSISSPPKQLYCRGTTPLAEILKRPCVAIVGSRGPSAYGQQVTTRLARQLAEQGIAIISGLAFGVDALAHQAALEVGGLCVAVLPGPLDKIYPRSNERLGQEILRNGGALVSEYDAGEISYKQNFIARNRLVAGLAQAVLVTEAGEGSGSLHTARFARKQGKKVLVVPGNITSPTSFGTNELLKSGAAAVTKYQDVLCALGINAHKTPAKQIKGSNEDEQTILELLLSGASKADELLAKSGLGTSRFNQTLTMLEVSGKIRPLGINQWTIS
ncbi:MAG TPA: DNA-processing protein DprA [Candidatus Saccharimonadales bacterium]|nr:DNA-processing protein DprA [Candidatus Saccharimonadales bacterium]